MIKKLINPKKILITATITVIIILGLIITPSTKAVIDQSNTNNYSFCSSATNGYVTDLNGSLKTTSDPNLVNFYVIRNSDKTNDTCTNGFVKTNFLPTFNKHDTIFDLDNDGSPINVKISNTNASSYSINCSNDGKTIVSMQDPENDLLSLSQVVNANNFDVSSTKTSTNGLTITFAPKNTNLNTTDSIDIYVTEETLSGNAGQFRIDSNGNYYAYKTSDAIEDTSAKIIKLPGVQIKSPTCQANTSISSTNTSYNSSSQYNSSNDIYWHNKNGSVLVWNMANDVKYNSYSLPSVGSEWSISGKGYFDNDRFVDIVWHNKNGQTIIWLMNEDNTVKEYKYIETVGTEWDLVGVEGNDYQYQPSLFWRNKNSGENIIWYMDSNHQKQSTKWIENVGTEWDIIGYSKNIIASSKSNSNPNNESLHWRDKNSGENISWHIDSQTGTKIETRLIEAVGTEWTAKIMY